MPKTNRLLEGIIFIACAPAMAAVVATLVVIEVVTGLRGAS